MGNLRRRRGGALLVALLVGALVLVLAPAAPAGAAAVATVVPYGLTPDAQGAIVAGPDGNLWFGASNGFGRVTPAGVTTVFPSLPPAEVLYPAVSNPAPGADGNVWFAITSGQIGTDGALARVTPAGTATYVTAPGQIRTPRGLALGPDGNIWFADATGAVGRVTPAGIVTRFPTPALEPTRITAGGDGNVWFAAVGGAITRITPTGTMTTFPTSGLVTAMTAGPDGNVWYTVNQPGTKAVRRITPAGVVTSFTGAQVTDPRSITAGPDGALWFANFDGTIGRATTAGALASFAAGVPKPASIAAGPDGNLWVTAVTSPDGSSAIVRMTTAGAPTVFTTERLVRGPASITNGPDGNRWFLNGHDGSVGRITPTGVITRFPGDGSSNFGTIAAGPDGNLWFTRPIVNQVVRMTPAGVMTAFDVPGFPGWEAGGITSGADGNLWFTQVIGDRIGRITPDGTITLFGGLGIRNPNQITAGPDGALWFTNASNTIGRITTAGQVTNFPGAGIADPRGITTGPDGNLWFANFANSSIGRITPSGQVTTFTAPGLGRPEAITAGADGNLWFTNGFPSSTIGRATPAGTITTFRQVGIDEPIALAPGSDGRLWIANGNSSISTLAVDDLPAPPTAVTAVDGQTEATVSWVPPTSTGGTPIAASTVTAAPGGATCATTTATTCTVTGLAPGTSYTFSVTARNATATSLPSAPSNAVVPRRGSGYHPVPAVRILDSRQPNVGFAGEVVSGTPRSLQVTGLGGPSNVPDTASAVVMNVTVADPTAESFLTVYPTGGPQPNASNLNFGAGQIVPNLVTVKLGPGGEVDIANAVGATNVIADVVGYYDDGTGVGVAAGARFNPVVPSRLLDSRTSTGGWDGPLEAGTPRDLITIEPDNPGGVYDGATSVIVNVTVTGGTDQSFVTLWETGKAQPSVSNLNLLPGQTVANLAIVPVGGLDREIRIANAVGSVEVIVDVVGYFDPNVGSYFHAMDPTRVLDTRSGVGLTGPQGPGATRSLAIAGATGTGVPAGATGLVANLTVADGSAESFVAMFPGNQLRPVPFSNVNFGRNQVIPNLATVGLPPTGSVNLYNQAGSTAIILDAVGYYSPT